MPTTQKVAVVEQVAEQLNQAKSVFLTDFSGLNVEEMNELRRAFGGANVQYRVVKNTLARLSVKSAGCEELLDFLEGPTGIAFGMDDPAAPAKVIHAFSRKSDKLNVKACLFEGVLMDSERLQDLATLPSRPEMLGRLSGVLNAPLSNLVYSLNGLLSKLVYALDAVKRQKEDGSQ
ncbi:MAG: 50S ribosomal protein L10 [Calditrichaeota bacterium]|nr:MAG: 50S ribosomal protein L10 [Calditrichota bacterium]